MAYEIWVSVEKTIDTLKETFQAHTEDLSLPSYLAKYQIVCGHENILKANFTKAGHKKQKPYNREYIVVYLEQMTNVDFSSIEKAIMKNFCWNFASTIHACFSMYDQEIFGATVWLDP